MKTIFKPALLALATVFTFGSLISCDQLEDLQKENEEQTEQQPEEQPEQQPEQTDTLSVDGKQWIFDLSGTGVFLDFGLKKEGILCSGYCDPATLESMMGMSIGAYTITATDATSGTINVEGVDSYTGEPATFAYSYKDLTENSVKIDFNIVYNMPPAEGEVTYADFTLATGKIEFEDMYDNQ